ncbi:MAG: DUF4071 domain-containing protein [Gammaproteobacteria bacterium]|nr:DUF4071 domain-containing protein [Gammaproteobacteria bacterium]
MNPHAFVAMPFGIKPGPDGTPIDFNRVYRDYIKPALEAAGLEVFRADEERQAGDIRTDMFQELLVADLVVADLTIDNPNVWYEVGVRHALRARGVVLVSGGQTSTAFDLYTDRKLRYGLADGGPDPETLELDKSRLVEMVTQTMESWHGRKTSPVYHLMPNLQEPDWKSLRIGDVREFWERHDDWEHRINLARAQKRIGDLLVLADEAPVAAFRAEAWIMAGRALRAAEQFAFALEQLEKGLEIEPEDKSGLTEKGICLQRLALDGSPGHSFERARSHYEKMLERFPEDPETLALLGRVDKDAWSLAWDRPGASVEEMREDAAYEDARLRGAIASYRRAYCANPGHYYSGINALTLMQLYTDLTGDSRYADEIQTMAGAVKFAAQVEPSPNQRFWSACTLGDLEVLVGTPDSVTSAYKEAIANNRNDWFALNSSRSQLLLLDKLRFHPENVAAGVAAFDRALQRLSKPEDSWRPRQVFLFSGHMVDTPDRAQPRFPSDLVEIAGERIAEALASQGAGPDDLALCQAAAGGDLLFLESCLELGMRCQVQLPFEEPEFIQRSVLPSAGGDDWCDRFYSVKQRLPELGGVIRIMPIELGSLPAGVDPFERCNLWLLYTALAWDVERVRFISLWNGGGGDGPGGTAHMYNEVKRRTGRVKWIDTRTLNS